MKRYETPIENPYESALSALARNGEDTLIRQREFQTIGILNGAGYWK